MKLRVWYSTGLTVLVTLGGCAQQGGSEGIQASERHECQKYLPVEEAACLERARQGSVIYTPDRRNNRWERSRR